MTTDKKVINTDPSSEDELIEQLEDLAEKVEMVNQNIEADNIETKKVMNKIIESANDNLTGLKQDCVDLDQIEEEAGDEFDKLALAQAEDLANEE